MYKLPCSGVCKDPCLTRPLSDVRAVRSPTRREEWRLVAKRAAEAAELFEGGRDEAPALEETDAQPIFVV